MTHTETVYLNGQFIPKHEAKISILDRGFLLADDVTTAYRPPMGNHYMHNVT